MPSSADRQAAVYAAALRSGLIGTAIWQSADGDIEAPAIRLRPAADMAGLVQGHEEVLRVLEDDWDGIAAGDHVVLDGEIWNVVSVLPLGGQGRLEARLSR